VNTLHKGDDEIIIIIIMRLFFDELSIFCWCQVSAASDGTTSVSRFSNHLEVSCSGTSEDTIRMYAQRYLVKPRKPQNRRSPSRDLNLGLSKDEDSPFTT
jgi:hypothetical protein